jgi:lipopolysaccharide export system permease protein
VSVLSNYIIGAILRSVATVVLTLTTIFALVQVVSQLSDVGTAAYGLREAALFVLLGVPSLIVESLPAAALIGTLLALGQLASQSELIAMRAAGVSKLQLIGTVGLAGILLGGAMAMLGDSFAPSLGAYARDLRAQAMLDETALADGQSSWLKDGDTILNIHRGLGGTDMDSGVYLFEIGADRSLVSVAHAESFGVSAPSEWALTDYAETRFGDDGVTALNTARSVHSYGFSTELLGFSEIRDDLLDTPELERYIDYLRTNGLDASSYLTAYWSRWSGMVSVPLMALLALPFAFGGLRSAGTGARLVIGLVIGLGLYVADQIFSNSGAAFGFDPLLTAWAPTLVLAVVSLIAVARLR